MRIKALSIIVLLFFCIPFLMAQEEVTIVKKEFKIKQKEGFKEAWKSIESGDEYFEAGLGTYALARDHYLFADQYNPDNPELNYKIGVCYLYSDDKQLAIEYLLKAYDLNPECQLKSHPQPYLINFIPKYLKHLLFPYNDIML